MPIIKHCDSQLSPGQSQVTAKNHGHLVEGTHEKGVQAQSNCEYHIPDQTGKPWQEKKKIKVKLDQV